MTAPTVDKGPVVTFEIMLQWKEEDDGVVPFSPDEKALALAVARAYYFALTLCEELPERAGGLTTAALAWSWGIRQVCERGAGRIWR
jgi:hypothetical protein